MKQTLESVFDDKLTNLQIDEFYKMFLERQDEKYIELEGHLLDDALGLPGRLTQKGVKQVIVTNRLHIDRGHASPRSIVERSSLKDHIHHIICGDETEVHKPNKEVLGTLLEDWNVEPEELLAIGDQHVYAQLALNLGAQGIIVNRDNAEFAAHHMGDQNWQEHIVTVASLGEVFV